MSFTIQPDSMKLRIRRATPAVAELVCKTPPSRSWLTGGWQRFRGPLQRRAVSWDRHFQLQLPLLAPLQKLQGQRVKAMRSRSQDDDSTAPVCEHTGRTWRDDRSSGEHPVLMGQRGGPDGPLLAWANEQRTLFHALQDPVTLPSGPAYRPTLGSDAKADVKVCEEADTALLVKASVRRLMHGPSRPIAAAPGTVVALGANPDASPVHLRDRLAVFERQAQRLRRSVVVKLIGDEIALQGLPVKAFNGGMK